jgi:hypothetical protein
MPNNEELGVPTDTQKAEKGVGMECAERKNENRYIKPAQNANERC